ncbi:MAG: DUF5667 domain-containing protein [Candidatus Sungiibacteriota bacterium]
MKRFSTIILVLLLAVVFSLPASVSAATSPGVKPGSFFYFFDTAFEKLGLFFTFNPEKKARKALEYADERLAEIESIAGEKDTGAVKTAITNYESNVALATEKSKEVKDKGQAGRLLIEIEDNAEKNQNVLSAVLIKVPDEAKEVIIRAIEVSRKGKEEAIKQITELKGEVDELKKEVKELKAKDKEQGKVIKATARSTTICNGVVYLQCPDDTKFICPKTSEGYCEMASNIKNGSVSISADTLVCNGKEWSKCPQWHNFYCPAQGDAQCVPQSSVSTNDQVDTFVSNQAVEKLLQQEIVKQNSWYEEYLLKQAEIDEKLKPINKEWDRIMVQIKADCWSDLSMTGQKAADCSRLTMILRNLESEASRVSGIYPERKILPKVLTPQFQQWIIDTMPDGMGGTIWSPYSTIRYRWSCINPYSCTLTNY